MSTATDRLDFTKTTSTLLRFPSYSWTTALLTKSFWKFWRYYFTCRSYPRGQEFYVVYTSLDHSIPFDVESAKHYWLVNFRFVPTVVQLREVTSHRAFDEIREAYIQTSIEARAAFEQAPTIMPHFKDHRKAALHAAQNLLRPINCCPSLHTATPLFFYNVGIKYFPEREPRLRRYIGDVVSTVIRTKLHAMVDVAFGMFLCKKTIIDRLGLEFDNLESFFTGEQAARDGVPYREIYRIYHEIERMAASAPDGQAGLGHIMERYFKEMGFPRVRRDQSACLYDIERKALVNVPGMRVGKGTF